jgi:hypothetical protein
MTKIEGRSYWDGGLFSNTPLSPAINALEEAAEDDAGAVLELVVVELFPMKAPIPNNLLEVQERMGQLQYTSRLKLDQHFFEEIDQFVDLMAKIDEGLKDHPEILDDPAYQRLRRHRKINHFNVVTSDLPPQLSNAADFSHSSIQGRIKAGYDDAMAQGIGALDSAGLRSGVTSAAAAHGNLAVPVA